MSSGFDRCFALIAALNNARDTIAEAEIYEDAYQAALAHLAPFFAQGVHSSTVATKGHGAENHGTDEVVVSYSHAVCRSNEGWLAVSDGSPGNRSGGPVFYDQSRGYGKWEASAFEVLDPDAVYELELHLRKREA